MRKDIEESNFSGDERSDYVNSEAKPERTSIPISRQGRDRYLPNHIRLDGGLLIAFLQKWPISPAFAILQIVVHMAGTIAVESFQFRTEPLTI